ncbi:hypothetical protein [Plantactinospora sp. B24E8]|uniref:Rv0361 family membrane protein n=1 Tax=Plantactinospora sp. B24E8 TaxID=3153567 RepID=UPI00325E8018
MTQPPTGDETATATNPDTPEPSSGQTPAAPEPRSATTSPVDPGPLPDPDPAPQPRPTAGGHDPTAPVPGPATPVGFPVAPGHPVPPGQFGVGYPPPPGQPPFGAVPTPLKKRRTLLIVSIVLAATLLLCVGGGVSAFLVIRNVENGEGAADPVAAVDGFLEAVYADQNAEKAASLVCAEARDSGQIEAKIEEVAGYARTYDSPRFRWVEPRLDERNAERALVSTTLTMVTGDERAVEQQLRFIVVEKTGWWVCDVN